MAKGNGLRGAIIAFVAGVGWLQWQPALFPALYGGVLSLALLGLVVIVPRWRRLNVLLFATVLGASYANGYAENRLAEWLPHSLENRPLVVTGIVNGLPQAGRFGTRIRFTVEQAPTGVPSTLLLNDYAKPLQPWQPGERWRLSVKLKRPHSTMNPGGYDYEAWLLSEGIGATGTIAKLPRDKLANFVATPTNYLHAVRAALANHIRHVLAQQPFTEVIVALVVGEQSGISQAQWQLFRHVGITHLVSISGLHITLVAGLVAGCIGWGWRRSPRLTLWCPSRRAAMVAGVLAALAYSVLAGFAVPTQRTFFMLMVAALALGSGRAIAVSTIWLLALGITVALDPWAVLSAGFWLSYLTVGAMLWALAGQYQPAQGWRQKLASWGSVQWAATLGSLPLLLVLFQQLPLTSPLANAIAIPLISSVATPLALVGSLDPTGYGLRAAHAVLAFTIGIITPLADEQWVWNQAQPASWMLIPAVFAVGALLLPRGVPARWLATGLLLPLLWPQPKLIRHSTFHATIFDVGQGLSVLINTANHHLLFDTGSETGGGRVLPGALRAAGVKQLDQLLLSHDDNDHIGAAAAVLGSVRVPQILGVSPHQPKTGPWLTIPPITPCLNSQRWVWDGVVFEMLNPPAEQAPNATDNARGCVLRVSGAGGVLMIPADIGVAEEQRLLDAHANLKADVLVMPHHGSATSSSAPWIDAVSPTLAVATVGYLNPFRHPRSDVVARYEQRGITVWRSDRDGAVQIEFGLHGWMAEAWRAQKSRYWFEFAGDKRIVATTTLPAP